MCACVGNAAAQYYAFSCSRQHCTVKWNLLFITCAMHKRMSFLPIHFPLSKSDGTDSIFFLSTTFSRHHIDHRHKIKIEQVNQNHVPFNHNKKKINKLATTQILSTQSAPFKSHYACELWNERERREVWSLVVAILTRKSIFTLRYWMPGYGRGYE